MAHHIQAVFVNVVALLRFYRLRFVSVTEEQFSLSQLVAFTVHASHQRKRRPVAFCVCVYMYGMCTFL